MRKAVAARGLFRPGVLIPPVQPGFALGTVLLLAVLACTRPAAPAPGEADLTKARERMVADQIEARGVKDPLTLAAMRAVPRHLFVSPEWAALAYEDTALPIAEGQTISQPYIVAFMTEALRLKGGERVLEVGTGSGYQAAVLARIAARVYTIEIVESLAREAALRLRQLGYANAEVRQGDGYAGWPEKAPFDGIVVTAAAPRVPEPLKQQLKDGGRLVVPVGEGVQELRVLTRRGTEFQEDRLMPVRFVPMTGKIRKP
jgi:protein-L-isoaspartate(D-aspartate) O-methyltransferase